MPRQPERLRARMKLAVRDAILEAAERSIAEDGVEAASLQAIARRAGVAVGTIYNHFEDRRDLFRALFDAHRAEILAAVDATLKAHAREPIADQLHSFARTFFEHYERRRDFFRVAVATESLRREMLVDKAGRFRPLILELEQRALRVVQRGVRDKQLRADAAQFLAPAFVGMLRATLLSRLADQRAPLHDEAGHIVALFLHGAARR
jgi:AcrR family transcriptional regulator